MFCCRSKEGKKYFKMSRSTKRFVFFRTYLFILFLYTYMFSACRFRQRTYMAQGLVNGVLTRLYSLNGFQLVMGLYGGHSPPFFSVCLP